MAAMEGRGRTWYLWWEISIESFEWQKFNQDLVERFQPATFSDPFSIFLKLKQESTVKDYKERFECYPGAVEMVDCRYLRAIFFNGLKEEITHNSGNGGQAKQDLHEGRPHW